ncbi:alanine/glycine:cation symporter family protein [Endozoicomonas montiporae]|uniref:Alanine or glycine:cation symporter, AGCS family n=1 Tax=Endozoicomonas montiporae CL-33 TaxID=570277 RepID=A0A142BHS5_9GAMM|nr:alanine/glycine:cation symporter family protein [Endozoicomonas montiporae]AMO58301.1 alanine or glycine:cation symporter, AGCS family [Endozoicomonas montiporae CL-33]
MNEFIAPIIDSLNGLLYGSVLIYLLVGGGIFFTVRTRFVQFRRFGLAVKTMMGSRTTADKSQISPFQAFCTSLAARIGTGNMAGVAVAIYLGGAGAVFWMWFIALLGMATSLAENVLAQIYKTNNGDGTYRGGPAYYIEKALGHRWLGVTFSISLIIAFGFAFNSVQSNSIAAAFSGYGIEPSLIGIALAAVSALIIFGGIRSISKVAEMIVPVMALGYLAIALIVVLMNVTELPAVFSLIFRSAFGFESAAGGAIGAAVVNGIKRGLFSNEAGMGSSPNAAAAAHSTHPVNQGLMGMLGVFLDTIVVCTATAAIILMSGMLDSGLTGIELTQAALSSQVGAWGGHLVALAILLFAFTSIIANYYYGESNLRFINDSKGLIIAYRVAVLAMVMWGSVSSLPTVWNFADVSMGVMALINMVAICVLSSIVIQVLRDYDEQLDSGMTPVFNRSKFPFLDKTMDKDVWQEHNDRSAASSAPINVKPAFIAD